MDVGRYDLLIIGGGISGLSLGHYASRAGMKTVLLEKAADTGGCLKTMKNDGYWLELGAHTCYNSYGNLIGVIEDCGLKDQLQARRNVPFKMLIDGKVKSIPSELNFFELLLSAPRLFSMDKSRMTVAAYYSGIVGRKNYDKVVGPALSAVPSQKADDFPADMLFKRRPRRKDILKKFTVKGGLQTIAHTIASTGRFEVMKGVKVKSVRSFNNLFTVSAENAGDLSAERIALAVPPPEGSALLMESFPAVASRLAEIKVAHIDSVGVVLKKGLVGLPEFAGLIPVDDLFFSIVSRDIVGDNDFRGFTFHFRPGLQNEIRMKRIKEVLGSDKFESLNENRAVMPAPVMGHRAITEDIDRMIKDTKLSITGNYFGGLAIEDCVSRSVEEFKRMKET